MRASVKIFSYKGIHIYLHWTLLFLLLWLLATNILSDFSAAQAVGSVLFLLALLACIALHELGHALVAARFGIDAKNIIIFPIGGIAGLEKYPEEPRQELAISLAGPLVSFGLALIISLFLHADEPYWKLENFQNLDTTARFLYSLQAANIFLALFNLIPAFPLDGGRILRALLSFRYNYIKATSLTAHISKITAWVLIVAGLLTINPFLPLIGVFIVLFARTEEHYLRIRSLVKDFKLKEALMYDYNSLQAQMKISEVSAILMNNHSKSFMVMEGARPVGTINRIEIIKAIAEMKYDTLLKGLMKEDLVVLDGETEVEDVLEKLSDHEDRIYPVMIGGRFTGVVSYQHIIEHLLLHKARTAEYSRIRALAGLL